MLRSNDISSLLQMIRRLNTPVGGHEQNIARTSSSEASPMVEVAQKVSEAVQSGDETSLRQAVGDLLFQVVLLNRSAENEGSFPCENFFGQRCARPSIQQFDVAETSPARSRGDTEAQSREAVVRPSALGGVAHDLPTLTRAAKLCEHAARTGFDWDDAADVLEKIVEEIAEVRAEMAARDLDRLEDEIGDVLFTTASFARKLGLSPEACLQRGNRKFEARFTGMEDALAEQGKQIEDQSISELEALWQSVKRTQAGGTR